MPKPEKIVDHPAPYIKNRAVTPKRSDKEFHLKAVPKVSWHEWYVSQDKWLD